MTLNLCMTLTGSMLQLYDSNFTLALNPTPSAVCFHGKTHFPSRLPSQKREVASLNYHIDNCFSSREPQTSIIQPHNNPVWQLDSQPNTVVYVDRSGLERSQFKFLLRSQSNWISFTLFLDSSWALLNLGLLCSLRGFGPVTLPKIANLQVSPQELPLLHLISRLHGSVLLEKSLL